MGHSDPPALWYRSPLEKSYKGLGVLATPKSLSLEIDRREPTTTNGSHRVVHISPGTRRLKSCLPLLLTTTLTLPESRWNPLRLSTFTLPAQRWRVRIDTNPEGTTWCTLGKSTTRGTESSISLGLVSIPPFGWHETSNQSFERKLLRLPTTTHYSAIFSCHIRFQLLTIPL